MKEKPIIGLGGPSAIGKGYCKEEIRKNFYGVFVEPIVVTTRQKRVTDGADRLSGISLVDFNEMRRKGQVIFAHQPFGFDGCWYGFLSSSIDDDIKPILTEIHPDNMVPFKERYNSRVTLISLIAEKDYLESNIRSRGSESESEIQTRLNASITEVQNIRRFKELGLVDYIVEVNYGNREYLGEMVTSLTEKILKHDD